MARKTQEDITPLGVLGDVADLPPNPDAAQDALHLPSDDTNAPKASVAEPAARPRRKTKVELEAEVTRLTAEVKAAQEKAQASAPDMLTASRNAMKATLAGGFGMAAMLRGEEHWRLSEREEALLADAWAPCIAMALGRHPEIVVWAGAIGVTYTVIAPRVMVSRTLAAGKTVAARTGMSDTLDREATALHDAAGAP